MSELPVEAEVEAVQPMAAGLPASATEIPVDQITPNPHQPRRQINEASIAELAASMKSTGVIQPVIVRKVESGYQLIAGERRWRAARLAGLTAVPAIVRDVDSFTQAQMALIENIQREDLNPMDRAQSYRALIAQLGLTQAELAARLGEDRSSIANFLRLLELTPEVQRRVHEQQLSLGHGKILAGVDDAKEQERLAKLVIDKELSVRALEKLIQDPHEAPGHAAAKTSPSAHIQDLERSISRQIGMRVQVRSGKGKGRLVIHYATLDQFDELLTRLGITTE
jgi:ParB family chromosome partitioning protein